MREIYYEEGERINNKRKYILKLFDNHRFPITYYRDNNFIQCRDRYRRSFLDIFWLFKSKFKTATKGELARILLDKENSHIGLFHCDDIGKAVLERREDAGDNIRSFINEDDDPGSYGPYLKDRNVEKGPKFDNILRYALRSKEFTLEDVDLNPIKDYKQEFPNK